MSARQTRRSARKASQVIQQIAGSEEEFLATEEEYQPEVEAISNLALSLTSSSSARQSSTKSAARIVEKVIGPGAVDPTANMTNTYDCPRCNIKFREGNLLKLHNKLVHKEDDTASTETPGGASQPKRMRPNEISPRSSGAASPSPTAVTQAANECTQCNIKFRSYELLKVHNKLVHQVIMPDEPVVAAPTMPAQQIKQEKNNAGQTLANAKIDESGQLRFDDDDGEMDAAINDNSMPPTPPPMNEQPETIEEPVQPAPRVINTVIPPRAPPASSSTTNNTRPNTNFECKLCNINFRSHALIKMHNKLVHKISTDEAPISNGTSSNAGSQHSPRYQQTASPKPVVVHQVQRVSPTPMTNGHHVRRVSGSSNVGAATDVYEINKALEKAVSTINQKCVSLAREKDRLQSDNERLVAELRSKDAKIRSMSNHQNGSAGSADLSQENARLRAQVQEQLRTINSLETKNSNIKKALKMMDI